MPPKTGASAKTPAKTPQKASPKPPAFFIARPASSGQKHCSKVYLHPESLKALELVPGDVVRIIDDVSGAGEYLAIASASESGSEQNVAELSLIFRQVTSTHLGDRLRVEKYTKQPEYAASVEVWYSSEALDKIVLKTSKLLLEVGLVSVGMQLSLETEEGEPISITVVRVDPKNHDTLPDIANLSLVEKAAYSATTGVTPCPSLIFNRQNTSIIIATNPPVLPQNRITFADIGGLDPQLKTVREIAQIPLETPHVFAHFNIRPTRGVLVHGLPGTGKSMLLEATANEFFLFVHIVRVDPASVISKYLGDAETRLKELFNEARKYEPLLILIDDIDALAPADDDNAPRLLAALLALMDGLDKNCRICVLAASSAPGSLGALLRRPGRLDKEIELLPPDALGRAAVLQKLFASMAHHNVDDAAIQRAASVTHGYVGADLAALVREAAMCAIRRGADLLTEDHLLGALPNVRPSAMRGIFLEMPEVHWSDIGGQHTLKRQLKEMVQLPLEASETFRKLGVRAPKGVLLYGPPGCSKTLTAKALATESGLNFLAVKGPELFNKYVGESERAIRDVFRKARAAAPSIVFFDEIDAISMAREDGGGVGSNVLTTLLNEIDGVEELNGVVIVGATNKPGSIDLALMRPGRLDRHIYVGPPDYEGILQILEMRTKKFGLEHEFLERLAHKLEGCSGAEVVLVCQEAGISAIMENQTTEKVEERHFEGVLAGLKRGITQEMVEYYESWGKE